MTAIAVRDSSGALWWYDIYRMCVRCKRKVAHLSNTEYSKRKCSKCNLVSTVRRCT